jgi:hypothetical protein
MLEPSPQLINTVLCRIDREKRLKILKKRLFFYISGTSLASVIFTLIFKEFSRQATESGFFQFFSLLFSDFGAIIRHFSDYVLSIIGSVPIISFGLVSVVLLGILFGAVQILGNLLEFRKLRHL